MLRKHHPTDKDPWSVLLLPVTSASQHKEHVRRRCKQSRILIIDTKTGGQDDQNIEYNNSEKSGFDSSRNGLVKPIVLQRQFSRCLNGRVRLQRAVTHHIQRGTPINPGVGHGCPGARHQAGVR